MLHSLYVRLQSKYCYFLTLFVFCADIKSFLCLCAISAITNYKNCCNRHNCWELAITFVIYFKNTICIPFPATCALAVVIAIFFWMIYCNSKVSRSFWWKCFNIWFDNRWGVLLTRDILGTGLDVLIYISRTMFHLARPARGNMLVC